MTNKTTAARGHPIGENREIYRPRGGAARMWMLFFASSLIGSPTPCDFVFPLFRVALSMACRSRVRGEAV